MGWDTQIIIIAENIESKDLAREIGKLIFEKDSKYYGNEIFYIIEEAETNSIYYSYERRKYAPYWVLEEISNIYSTVHFTILGSMLDFLCGPGGVFKIKDGKTIDSYGIYGENSKRHQIIDRPIELKYEIYNWFKHHGNEAKLRNEHIQEYPFGSCNDNLVDKVIPIDNDIEMLQLLQNETIQENNNWIEQPKFELIMSHNEYQELTNSTNKIEITEQSFIAYVEHSKQVAKMENRVLNLVKGKIVRTNPFNLYFNTFGRSPQKNEIIESEFKYLNDFDQNLDKYEDEIIAWGLKHLEDETRIVKGFPITWMINLMKEKKASS